MTTTHRVHFGTSTELSFLDDGSVDLVVTSPPYPMIEMWDQVFGELRPGVDQALAAGEGPSAYGLMHGVLDEVWAECFRVLRPGGFLCVNIGDATRTVGSDFRLYTNHVRVTSACEALGFHALPPVNWWKPTNGPTKFMGSGMLPAGAYVTLEREFVLIFRRGSKRSFQGEDRSRRRRSAFFWEERNRWFSDVWDFKGVRQGLTANKARERSGAFPFELAFRLINMYSLQEDLVLDPFVGTGTTMAAAAASARNSVGVEVSKALAPIIDRTLREAATVGNERQRERLTSHEAFVDDYRERRGQPPAHINGPHQIPVVTGQEVDLQLPEITSIEKVAAGEYRAGHRPLVPPDPDDFVLEHPPG